MPLSEIPGGGAVGWEAAGASSGLGDTPVGGFAGGVRGILGARLIGGRAATASGADAGCVAAVAGKVASCIHDKTVNSMPKFMFC